MRLFNFFTKKKLLLLNILLTLYIITNMIGGERGLVSYYEKEKKQQNLIKKEKPDYLIIHLISFLPLSLLIFSKFETKFILRISGYPKLNVIRKFFWKKSLYQE